MAPRTQPGEGIVIVIDVSPCVRASTEVTFYDQAKECLINILQRKMFANKCKDVVGIVLFGTDGTNNVLASGDQYEHITVLQKPKFVDWDLLSLANNLPSGNSHGDWLDAIVVAMDLLHDPNELLYSTKKLVLLTDFSGEFSDHSVTSIIEGIKKDGIDFSVIGPSFDDDCADGAGPSTNGNGHLKSTPTNWNGKPKTMTQVAAETLVQRIIAEVEGIACSFDEAIPQLIFFEKKAQGSANWNAMLDIGPNFKLPVTGRIKVKRATPATWKKAYAADESAAIIAETSYHKQDEAQQVVDERDIISGYKYGTTLVPFGDQDQQLKYSCEAQEAVISVLGFTRTSNVGLHLRAGDQVMIITAKDGDEDGVIALSSIIQALSEADLVAITRKVYRKGVTPGLGALYPQITANHECLVWVGIPYQEDIRMYSFPSLEKALSSLTKDQKDAMDTYIDAMDLSMDDDEEYLNPNLVVNPLLQHHFNCFTQRAVKPDDPLPPPAQHIMDLLSTPEHMRDGRDLAVKKVASLMPTTKMTVEKKSKLDLTGNDDSIATTSDAAASDLASSDLTKVTVVKIGTVTPAQDFLALLTQNPGKYQSVCVELCSVLFEILSSLTGATSMDNIMIPKLIAGMKVLRGESKMIDPTPYNSFVEKCKQYISAPSTPAMTTFWQLVQQENLGPISSSDSLKSLMTPEEAEAFMVLSHVEEEAVAPQQEQQQEFDDLLDEL